MSQENVELYRSQISAVQLGDWDAVAAHLDPDVLVRTDPGWPEQRIYGRGAVVAWMRDVTESVGADFRIDEIVDLRDRVLARWCWKTRGDHSRIGGELRYSEITTYRGGRAILIEHFRDQSEALKAVGLEEQAMSQENVELVRAAYRAFNEGDVQAVAGALADTIEWNASDVFFDEPRTYIGREAWVQTFLRDLMDLFSSYRVEIESVRGAGDQIAAIVQVGGTGRKSGVEVLARVGHVMDIRDAVIVRFTEYKDVAEALKAVGLEE